MTSERIHRPSPGPVGLRCRVLLLGLLLVSLSPCLAEGPSDREGVPAYRRLVLPPDRLTQELKRVRDGVLVRLSLAEFEDRVERAKHIGGKRTSPRLVETRY